MKFLIHLDDDYDSIRGQILPMEPLPTVNKAYLMIQRIKKQKQITGNASVTREIVANVSRPGANDSSSHDSLNALLAKNSQKGRKDFKKNNKGNRFCDHCQRSGHTQDQCFQLIGYSVWYEGPKERGKLKKPSKMAANVMTYEDHDTPLDEGSSSGFNGGGHFDGNMLKALSQEMMKMMKGSPTVIQQSEGTQSYAHFAGKDLISSHSSICCAVPNSCLGSWIVDSGASDHMTFDINLFSSLNKLAKPVLVALPDGILKHVTSVGDIFLHPNLHIHKVLYVPEFKYNLLSVTKLLNDHDLCDLIYPDKCVF